MIFPHFGGIRNQGEGSDSFRPEVEREDGAFARCKFYIRVEDRFCRFEVVIEQHDWDPGGIRFPGSVADVKFRLDRFPLIEERSTRFHAGFDSAEEIAFSGNGHPDVVKPDASGFVRCTQKTDHITASLFGSGAEGERVLAPFRCQAEVFSLNIDRFSGSAEVGLQGDAAAALCLK